MTLHINHNADRIVCRWREPVRVRMASREGVYGKIRTLNLTLDDQGRVSARDRKRHGAHPLFAHAERFGRELARIRYFERRVVCICGHCGDAHEVLPHYDVDEQAIHWRCADSVACSARLS
ncbi:MAG: hypothetical protein AB7D51_00830 [Desulfovibrionaceae bacterium]|jgi:hypothetical protein